MIKKTFGSFALLISMTQVTFGFKLPVSNVNFLEQEVTSLDEQYSYDFSGIVALSNCSGSLFRFEHSQDSDHGLILTNGHCVGMIPNGKKIINRNTSRDFAILSKDGRRIGSVSANKLLYATMTKTDIAIYELDETYEEIARDYNTQALLLSSAEVNLGEDIEVISGYWKKGYSCATDAIIHKLKEAEWTFESSIRYSQPGCETIGGTSGSPIVSKNSRMIIGVNNTGNEDGERCTMNNPCEVDESGNVTYEQGRSYGQQTRWLYTCLNENGKLDTKVAGCLL